MSRTKNQLKQIESVIEYGHQNKLLLPEVQNWCIHLELDDISGGMIAPIYKIPINLRVSCPHAEGSIEGSYLGSIAGHFLQNNCENCTFHKPIMAGSFGERFFEELKAERLDQERQTLIIENARKELHNQIKSLIASNRPVSDIPQLSILKLVEELHSSAEKKETAEKLIAAASLQPQFFTDAALEVVSAYFSDEEIGAECLKLVAHVLSATDRRPVICYQRSVSAVNESRNFDTAVLVLQQYISPDKIPDYKEIIIDLVHRLRYERNMFESDTEKNYEHAEAFLKKILKTNEGFLYGLVTNELLVNNKSDRINVTGLLRQLLGESKTFDLRMMRDLIRSLELDDDSYMESADKKACNVISRIIQTIPDEGYAILEADRQNCSKGALVSSFWIYSTLLEDSDFISTNPAITGAMVSYIVKIAFDRSADLEIRDKAFEVLYYGKEKLSHRDKIYFDALLGGLGQLVEEKITFKWYLQELENNKPSTFNPLVGKDYMDIHSTESKIEYYISRIKNCLTEMVNGDQRQYIPFVYQVLFPLDSKTTGSLKKELISLVRQSCTDPVLLSPLIPKLYDYLFDHEDILIRVEAIRLLEHLVSDVPKVVTSTLLDVIDIFLTDDHTMIRGEAVSVLETIIEKSGENITKDQIDKVSRALADRYIYVQKKAFPICYNLAPYLDKNQQLEFIILLGQCEPHYKEKKEYDVCRQILNCMIAVAASNHQLTDGIVRGYIVPYCMHEESVTSKDFLDLLCQLKDKMGRYLKEWLTWALHYLQISDRDKYNSPAFDPRNDVYNDIYDLPCDLVTANSNELVKAASQIAVRDPHDSLNFIFILSHFELHHCCIEICDVLVGKIPATKSNETILHYIHIFMLTASVEIQAASGTIDKNILESLENERKRTFR